MGTREPRYIEIADTLGMRIAQGDIEAGDIITLAAIAREFECSRTVAREVQRLLESCGLVVAQRRVGLIVQPLEQWNVFSPRVIGWRLAGAQRDRQLESLTEMRLAIEPRAVFSAAKYATREQREEILRTGMRVVELGAVDSGPEFMAEDIRFHRLILQYSGNEMFAALAPVVESVLTWRTERGLMPPHPEPRAMADHEAIALAIYRAEPEEASRAMFDLVDEVQEAFASATPHILREH